MFPQLLIVVSLNEVLALCSVTKAEAKVRWNLLSPFFFSCKLSLSKTQTLFANMLNSQALNHTATTTVNPKAKTVGSVCTGQWLKLTAS